MDAHTGPLQLQEAARRRLATTRFADVDWVAEVASTNHELLSGRRRAGGERVLVADHQTAGRGRLDRRWEDVQGSSLLVSYLLRCTAPSFWPVASLALAVRDTVVARGARNVSLKWPNDLVVATDGGTGKLAGILAEAVTGYDGDPALVVGLGLNVGVDLPHDDAASLAQMGVEVTRVEALAAITLAFEENLGADASSLRHRYLAATSTVGSVVRVIGSNDEITGRAVDIDDDGLLVVEGAFGRHAVHAGDVVHLRGRPGVPRK